MLTRKAVRRSLLMALKSSLERGGLPGRVRAWNCGESRPVRREAARSTPSWLGRTDALSHRLLQRTVAYLAVRRTSSSQHAFARLDIRANRGRRIVSTALSA